MKRPYKEYKLDITDKINLSLKTFDSEKPYVCFLNGRCWVTPTEVFNYMEIAENYIEDFKKSFRSSICKVDNFENKFIFDMDMKYHRLVKDKKTFFEFEIFLKQKKDKFLSFKELKKQFEKENIIIHINTLIKQLEQSNFILEKSK